MCKKCQNIHSGLCPKHHNYKLINGVGDIFTGFCQEEGHFDILEFYCKTHSKLCCSGCISKIKRKGKGEHTDCDICIIEDIKNEKKVNLEKNIKNLEELSNNLKTSIDKLKNIFETIIVNKEELKVTVQKIFTKIRNIINERENEIFQEIDNQFNTIFFSEEFLKETEKLPNKIKTSLEKGKNINVLWEDENKLNLLIYDCLNIENNIEDINKINEKMEKYNSSNIKIKFTPEDNSENRN